MTPHINSTRFAGHLLSVRVCGLGVVVRVVLAEVGAGVVGGSGLECLLVYCSRMGIVVRLIGLSDRDVS